MTGTEAISNAVPVFKPPESKNAARTLVAMVTILATFYLGDNLSCLALGIVPYPNQNPTLDSQIAALLFAGRFAWFYYVVQFATLLILVLAANTSFADFPRLSSILARDGFLPHQFAFRGDRLAFSTGIAMLAALSSILLVVSHGNTEALISLTPSASSPRSRSRRLVWSRAGIACASALVRTGAGRWASTLWGNPDSDCGGHHHDHQVRPWRLDRGAARPASGAAFCGISKHYAFVQRYTRALTPLQAQDLHHVLVVPIAELNRPARQALAYALSLMQPVVVLHRAMDEADETAFRIDWDEWAAEQRVALEQAAEATRMATRNTAGWAEYAHMQALVKEHPKVVVIQSPYRALVPPVVRYIEVLRDANPHRTVSVLLPGICSSALVGEPAPQSDRLTPQTGTLLGSRGGRTQSPLPSATVG